LRTYCDPLEGEWSLSWVDPGDLIRIWLEPDKSNGDEENPGPGLPLVNGAVHAWPPPPSVWVEARETYDEIQIDFTIIVGDTRDEKTDTTRTKVTCSPTLPRTQRYYARAAKWAFEIGAQADILTVPATLCGQDQEPSRYSNKSNAMINVERTTCTPRCWAQIGYGRRRLVGSAGIEERRYFETKSEGHDDYAFIPGIPSGVAEYRVYLDNLSGKWYYIINGKVEHSTPPNMWAPWAGRDQLGDFVTWSSEIRYEEDQMVGQPGAPCTFEFCRYTRDDSIVEDAFFIDAELRSDDPEQWIIQLLNPHGDPAESQHIQIWDAVPD